MKQLRSEKILAEVKYLFLVHKIYNARRKVFLHQKTSERTRPLFSKSLKGMVTKNFPGGFAPKPIHLPISVKCLHSALDQVKVSKSTIRKIRKIARDANLVRDLITMFDLKGRHFAAAPLTKNARQPLSPPPPRILYKAENVPVSHRIHMIFDHYCSLNIKEESLANVSFTVKTEDVYHPCCQYPEWNGTFIGLRFFCKQKLLNISCSLWFPKKGSLIVILHKFRPTEATFELDGCQ